MKTIKLFIYGLAMIIAASSCIDDITVEGNGIEASESRIVSSFDRVNSSGSFRVHITEGTEHDVLVTADENLLQYIETYVSGDVLHIDVKGIRNLRNTLPMEVYVVTPELEGIKLSGSGTITTNYFYTDKMDLILSGSGRLIAAFEADETDALLSGSGRIELTGSTEDARFIISGSGTIDGYTFDILDCNTTTSGSGDMYVDVSRKLHADISGSGNVFYYGDPNIETHISGSGSVISQN
ncbi:head GIN domain-containing protein [Draconibacterium sp. IB214405]|uniref:head GIN domain-containing protein n=1 Tax=Draconibacterium sp. IB214405 TaxID=3097352 RepID=UPI002A0CB449|nr:head GIN domain-containing protein [Draconibacterium sp. IB214405]MDX8338337.1 head GIN domain-containing protein [Draconibacterium sp. IB214405]